ncbi:MAG: methyl-accepting chemotaxis protein [Spirochaetes bacterium]|nr:methyl-accepting chemotaxis protein [Spirochaetota bacterium]
MRMTIGKKLALGFGVVVAIMAALVVYNYTQLRILQTLQDEGAERAKDGIIAQESADMGAKMYQVIADTIINRDFKSSEKDWDTIKTEALEDIKTIASIVDTDVEKRLQREAEVQLAAIIAHYEKKILPAAIANDIKLIRTLDDEMDGYISGYREPQEKIAASILNEQHKADAVYDATIATIIVVSVVLALLGAILAIMIALIITRSITRPLNAAVGIADTVARGDLTIVVDAKYIAMKDEIGLLANALSAMLVKLREVVDTVQTSATNVASGSGQMSSSSEMLSQGANEQAASVEEISSSVEEVSSSIEEVSSSVEQMTATIQQNFDNASQTEKIAAKSANDAKDGGSAVSETVAAMKEIADKVTIIQEIARQTNLLSLNASIEAARAGEQGKGFAVVASEVQKLADRSQRAAGEIGMLSKKSVGVAEKAGEMLSKLVPDIQKTAELVAEISAASSEQNNGAKQINNAIQQVNTVVQQVNGAVQQLSSVVQQNSANAEEVASTAEELNAQASQMQDATAFFKLDEGTVQRSLPKTQAEQKKLLTHTVGGIPSSRAAAHSPAHVAPVKPKPKIAVGGSHAAVTPDKPKGAHIDMTNPVDDEDGEFKRY